MSHSDLVHAFIGAWEARDAEAIIGRMTPDAVYHNIGLPPAIGHEAIRAVIGPFLAGSSKVEWTTHQIAETAAGLVMTERTDVFVMGDKTVSIPVMGIFEFKDGLISAWRDYFDVPGFMAQMA